MEMIYGLLMKCKTCNIEYRDQDGSLDCIRCWYDRIFGRTLADRFVYEKKAQKSSFEAPL